MADNTINTVDNSAPDVRPILDLGDGPLFVTVVNSSTDGLQTEVIDVRSEAPDAFPPRTADVRVVTEIDSFKAEITRRALVPNESTVWGNRQAGTVTVVYNELSSVIPDDYTRRDDRLVLRFVPDPDWATFRKAADGGFHPQDEFGDLIESAGHLITSHQAAELMEIVDSIRASSKGSFESRIRRETGSQHLTFSEEVSTKAGSGSKPLEVPREVTFSARPFEDYPEIEIVCWLRVRISQGQLYLGLFPQPYEHKVRDAWTHVTTQLATDLNVPVYAANLGKA